MNGSLANKVTSGLLWSFDERILAQLTSLIVSAVLASNLLLKEYGVVSLIVVFIALANVFVADGFGESLVQIKRQTKRTFRQCFGAAFRSQ